MSNVFHLYQLGDDFVEFTDRNGRTWQLAPLTVAQRSRLQSRIRDKLTDPMTLYHEARKGEPPQVAAELFKVAVKERAFWPPPVESCGVVIAETPELRSELIRSMLERNHPSVTREEAEAVADEIGNVAFGQAFTFALTGLRPDDPNLLRAVQESAGPTGTN